MTAFLTEVGKSALLEISYDQRGADFRNPLSKLSTYNFSC